MDKFTIFQIVLFLKKISMKLVSNLVNSIPVQTTTLVSIVAILAVFGPFISVSGGFWDAVNHLLDEPDYFWSIQHMVVYFGVSLVASAGFWVCLF